MEEKEGGAKAVASTTMAMKTTQTRRRHHLYRHHTTIEGARKELDEAKQRVLELEDLIKCLEKEEDSKKKQSDNNDSCHKALSQGNTLRLAGEDSKKKQSSNNDSCHNAFQDNTLRLTLGFLGIKDVDSCSKVCHQWEDDIDTNPQTWKKALENDGWGSFVQDLETRFRSSSSSSEEESAQPSTSSTSPTSKSSSDRPSLPPDYYKNIALGIIRDREQATQNDRDRVLGYKPKLNPKDIFLVLEVKDKYSGEIIGVFNGSVHILQYPFRPYTFIGNDMFLPATLDDGDWTFDDHYNDFRSWKTLRPPRPFIDMVDVQE